MDPIQGIVIVAVVGLLTTFSVAVLAVHLGRPRDGEDEVFAFECDVCGLAFISDEPDQDIECDRCGCAAVKGVPADAD